MQVPSSWLVCAHKDPQIWAISSTWRRPKSFHHINPPSKLFINITNDKAHLPWFRSPMVLQTFTCKHELMWQCMYSHNNVIDIIFISLLYMTIMCHISLQCILLLWHFIMQSEHNPITPSITIVIGSSILNFFWFIIYPTLTSKTLQMFLSIHAPLQCQLHFKSQY